MQPFCSVILCWSFTCSDMAITSFLNIFEVTPYMIVSEQDSETSLNRRKPRPPADAAWIWIDLLIGMFQEHWTVLAHLTREFHPLRFSQVAPFACDGSRPFKAVSTLGLRLDNRISPIYGSSPQTSHGLFVRGRLLPLYLLSQVGIVACSIPHGFPFGRISDVSNVPIQFSSCRQPARMHRFRYIRAEWRVSKCVSN